MNHKGKTKANPDMRYALDIFTVFEVVITIIVTPL